MKMFQSDTLSTFPTSLNRDPHPSQPNALHDSRSPELRARRNDAKKSCSVGQLAPATKECRSQPGKRNDVQIHLENFLVQTPNEP